MTNTLWRTHRAGAARRLRVPRGATSAAWWAWAVLGLAACAPTPAARPAATTVAAATLPRTVRPESAESVVGLERGSQLVCLGAVVGAKTVLTARHCLPIDGIRVVAGKAAAGEGPLPLEPTPIAVTGDDTPPGLTADLAIVETAERIPAPCVRIAEEDEAELGEETTVVLSRISPPDRGFDIRHPSAAAGGEKIKTLDCRTAGAQGLAGCAPALEFALDPVGTEDTSPGDSGGPVLAGRVGRRATLIGVTSRSVPHAAKAAQPGGIYTRGSVARGWLKSRGIGDCHEN